MKRLDLSATSVIGICAVILALTSFCEAGSARTDPPLKCHVCDPESCKDWNKKSEPKECTINDLNRDNIGPSKLSNFSYIPFSQLHKKVPEFLCQKIEAYDIRGMYIVRKCQLKLPGNESCVNFYKNLNADPEKTYTNATCHLCDNFNGCNSSGLIYIWAPLLLSSIVLCLLIK
ncbi:uncharacterized protein LOC129573239 [Sitodiplosis mosellana]|uniref:uncharacterized protein LOC129573239 n=1 Tax=Sitodiplosis mosellana TaxID=263140 RepID=UPI0024437E14|nr:uncharacterized protein LOC129573239 [Sitodiplosis mosellana]